MPAARRFSRLDAGTLSKKIEAVLNNFGVIVFSTPSAGMRLAITAAHRVIETKTEWVNGVEPT